MLLVTSYIPEAFLVIGYFIIPSTDFLIVLLISSYLPEQKYILDVLAPVSSNVLFLVRIILFFAFRFFLITPSMSLLMQQFFSSNMLSKIEIFNNLYFAVFLLLFNMFSQLLRYSCLLIFISLYLSYHFWMKFLNL